jgi:hypothetical protein
VIIHCNYPGCPAWIEVNEGVSPAVTYSCREHTQVGEDKVRFQESQFDPEVGSGTDPKSYERGHQIHNRFAYRKYETGDPSVDPKENPVHQNGRVKKTRFVRQAEALLQGHENETKILDVLTEDVRDSNSGTDRKDE